MEREGCTKMTCYLGLVSLIIAATLMLSWYGSSSFLEALHAWGEGKGQSNVSIDLHTTTSAWLKSNASLVASSFTNCSVRPKMHFLSQKDCNRGIFISKAACEEHRSMQTYLTSSPGSGNTWLRALLEGLTRVYTGSIYCDRSLLLEGFKGECVENHSTVIGVKTHKINAPVGNGGGQAIIVMRNPLDAILAECQRLGSPIRGHDKDAKRHDVEITQEKLLGQVKSNFKRLIGDWKMHTEWYMNKFKGRSMFVRYEDMKSDAAGVYTKQILPFLRIDTSHPEVVRALKCEFDQAREGTHRKHSYMINFTAEQIELARKLTGHLLPLFNYTLPAMSP